MEVMDDREKIELYMKKNRSILIVDDNPDHCELMCKFLEDSKQFRRVKGVNSAEECLKSLSSGEFNLAVIDYKMPDMNGLEVLSRITRKGWDVPVIIVTGEGDERIAVEAMKGGAYDYIIKSGGYITTLPHVLKNTLERHNLKREQERLTKELKESEERYRSLFEGAGEGILVSGSVTKEIIFANPAICRMLGYEKEEFKQMSIFDIYHRDDLEYVLPELESQVSGKKTLASNIPCSRKDGTKIYVDINIARLSMDGRDCNIGFFADITERRRAEEELQKKAEELARSNAELEQFAYIASHDLQEPLHKIQAFSDMIISKYIEGLNNKSADYLNRIRKAAIRMNKMIDNILALSRVMTKAQPFVMINLADVVNEVVSDFEVAIQQKGARIEISDLPVIEGDPLQMNQLLVNLIGNAIKYQRDGIAPVIKIYSKILSNGHKGIVEYSKNIDFTKVNDDSICRLHIEDNGIGFDLKYLDRIFQPFQRLHGINNFEGTGIGLAICRRIVERHKGSISAESEPGRGANFIVNLPVKQTNELREA